jgi:hypothetical protein
VDGDHSPATKAQMEVALGRVARSGDGEDESLRQCIWQL